MKILNKLAECKQWIIRIVMVRYFIVLLKGKRNLLIKVKERMAKEYLLWTIRCSKSCLTKKDYPFIPATSAELGIELGLNIDDALDFHNELNRIINAP